MKPNEYCQLIVIAAIGLLASACAPHPVAVAVQPIKNHIFFSVDGKLQECAQDLTDCAPASVDGTPVAATYVNKKAVYITSDTLHKCADDSFKSCPGIALTFNDAVAVGGGDNDQIVVISSKGQVDLCTTRCEMKTPAGRQAAAATLSH